MRKLVLACLLAASFAAGISMPASAGDLTSAQEAQLKMLLDQMLGPAPDNYRYKGYANLSHHMPVPRGCYEGGTAVKNGRTFVRVLCPGMPNYDPRNAGGAFDGQ